MNNQLLAVSLAIIILSGTIPFSFAESEMMVQNTIQSPKKQLESGVLPEEIQCRENRVLVYRDDNRVACVKESTAERMGWKIIETVNVQSIPVIIEKTIEENKLIIEKTIEENKLIIEKTIEIIPKEKTSWIHSETDLSYMDLEKIPNPDGYWFPLDDIDAFTSHFLGVIGDDVIEVKRKSGSTTYVTNHGALIVNDVFSINTILYPITYVNHNSELYKEFEQLEFIKNFMDEMNFKYDTMIEYVSNGGTTYILDNEYGGIKFTFHTKAYVDFAPQTKIEFNGWTNHPELVTTTLNKDDAKQIAYDFAMTNEELNKSHRDGGNCEYQAFDRASEDITTKLSIISGVPHYNIKTGHCTYDSTDTGHYDWPLVLVDAWSGEQISLTYLGGLD